MHLLYLLPIIFRESSVKSLHFYNTFDVVERLNTTRTKDMCETKNRTPSMSLVVYRLSSNLTPLFFQYSAPYFVSHVKFC
jgi:hypothetical protein